MILARPYQRRIRLPVAMARRRETIRILRALADQLGHVPSQTELKRATGIHYTTAARRFMGRPRPTLPNGMRATLNASVGLHRLYRLAGLVVRKRGVRSPGRRDLRPQTPRVLTAPRRQHHTEHRIALQVQRLDEAMAIELAREAGLPRRPPPLRTPEQPLATRAR